MADKVKFKAFPTAFKLAALKLLRREKRCRLWPGSRAFRVNFCMIGARPGSCMGRRD